MLLLENVTKTYNTPDEQVNALDGVSLEVGEGEFVVLRGPSGSGKTTLLMTIAGMLRPTAGSVVFADKDIYRMTISERANFRARNVGFVFQMFHLVPYLTAIDNILLPGAVMAQESKEHARKLVERFGLSGRGRHKPSQLSAGEKQRVAIARALFNDPKMILADEPTGNLDPDNAHTVLKHLSEYHRHGGTVVVVTHGSEVQEFADRIIDLRAGRINDDNGAS